MANSDLNSALGIGAAPALQPMAATLPGDLADRAASRYIDGYRVARFIVGLGTLIKVLGAVAGVLVLILGFAGASDAFGRGTSEMVGLVSFLMGAVVWFVFFIAGVIVSAQGQQLKASLDSAVHSSPFLDPEGKARAMSL
ncbi:MAG TPA: hypothetical protein VFR24_01110 [Candidatus Angelobacter sp.]|nr:hypothetical protein [Candidatus Angelobacter sp.]